MHFQQAICRVPHASCAQGLSTANLGSPDAARTRAQFEAYVRTLLDLGMRVTVLPALEGFPDAHFVEDTAVVGPDFALLTQPGAPSRAGEVHSMAPVLALHRRVTPLQGDARMDGGDVLMVDRQFFVGLSSRTNEAGLRALAALVEPLGYQVHAIEVRAGLHLKSVVNYVGRNTLLLNAEAARHPAFSGLQHLVLDSDEEYAGNTLWINDTLLLPAGYPKTRAMLQRALGLPMLEMDTSEIRKMDGGLTCLSLRF